MYSRDQLVQSFRQLGVAPGDTIMVHAFRRRNRWRPGPNPPRPQAGTHYEGTLMMYASCPRYYDEVDRGHLTPEQEKEILEKLPAFDSLTARSARDNGALVELLRTYPGSLVNHHVARFVVWGKHAKYLTSDQPWDYAFGFGSALDRFLKLDGKILLLGCDHDTVTFLHYTEHIVEIPDKRVAWFRVPIEEDGKRVWREMEEFDTSGEGAHPNWPPRFFSDLVDGYLLTKNIRGLRVGNALSYLFSAADTNAARKLRES